MKLFSIESDNGTYVELSAPLKVYYDVTNRCNLDCVFCFKEKSEKEITKEQVYTIVQKIADANIPDLVFIGGEPMFCPFIFEALEYAKERGINPGIVTNGTLFTKENVKRLKPLVNNSISISIHAPNDTLHDKISKGTHVHTKIIEGLKLLNANHIIPELAFTPVKDNISFLFETIDDVLSRGIEISDLLVNRLIPFGNAIKDWQEKEVSYDDQLLLFQQMYDLNQKYPQLKIASGDAIPLCVLEEKYRGYVARCDYAITLGWINDRNLFGKCMVRGSTNADSLDNHDLRELWAHSEAFLCHRHMRNLMDECKKCEWLIECGGGCACSGLGNTVEDAFLSEDHRYKMPPHKRHVDNVLVASQKEIDAIHNDDIYTIEKHFTIRKEYDTTNDECNYLFMPAASGAVIQDIITPESGKILWINAMEKQIIIYLQAELNVSDIAKNISYEYNISWQNAVSVVKSTIAVLNGLEMITLK